jgi:molecular chaperone GrpE
MKRKEKPASGEEESLKDDFREDAAQAGQDQESPDPGDYTECSCDDEAVEGTQDAAALKLAELNDRYLRLYAEYDNFRKRTQKEKEAIYGDCVARVTAEWLPVIDNLSRAADAASRFESGVDRSISEGIELVLRQSADSLARLGVEVIEAVGRPFDPSLHEAVMQVDQDGAETGTVVEEFQKGYRKGDRIIRHSMVKVAN